MTKADVIAALMEKTGLARQEATIAVETFLDQVRSGLQRGEKVSLVGFGSFYVKEQRPRQGRNPRTGEAISIPGKRVTVFKPGKSFRELANGGRAVPAEDGDDEGEE